MIGFIVLLSSVTNAAGYDLRAPFGIREGQRLETLGRLQSNGDNHYSVSVPNRHPLLSKYSVVANAQVGVCEVTGYAPLSSRSHIDRVTTTIRRQISELLGQPQHLAGVVTNDPNDTDVWLWTSNGSLKVVSLHRYRQRDQDAAMLKFTFKNEDDCKIVSMPNPFR